MLSDGINLSEIKIGDRKIGTSFPVFIIAELSCNHLQNYDLAEQTIKEMKKAGADCVKLQTSKPESITIDSDKEYFKIKADSLWDNKTLFELYKETYTPWEWHKPLKELVENLGMVFMSSPFDFEAVDFLDNLGVPAFKIASFEINDIPLIQHIAKKGKPILLSTGMATEDDISLAIKSCQDIGNQEIILLKCTSAYPTPMEEVNLNSLNFLQKKFSKIIGLSDHTIGATVPIASVALGAKVVEKHFILDRKLGGPDSTFSMEPNEFAEMVESIRNIEKAMGNDKLELSKKIIKNKQFMRSLFVVEDIKKGEVFTEKNIKSIRPGFGLHPKYFYEILNKKASLDIEKGTPLNWEMINND